MRKVEGWGGEEGGIDFMKQMNTMLYNSQEPLYNIKQTRVPCRCRAACVVVLVRTACQ